MKIRYLRWWIAALLMLVTVVNYLDRNSLSIVVASDQFKGQFHLTATQYAYIIMAFQFMYMIFQPLSGRFIDWIGTRKGFSIAVVWWSIATMLHALARSPLHFGIFRGLLGIGEAGNFPGANKTISEWFPPKERTIATGVFNIGSSVGATVAPVIVYWLIVTWGWQSAFIVTGAVGFFWVVLWQMFYHAPEEHPNITKEELDYIQTSIAAEPVIESGKHTGVWKMIIFAQSFWALGIARFLSEPAWQFASNWVPKYFSESRGIDLKGIAIFTAVTFIAADVGSIVGGFLSPWFMKLGFKLMNARRMAVTVGALLMPGCLLIAGTSNPYLALGFLSMATFGHQCISATLLTMPADLFPKRAVATGNGMSGFMGYLGGFLFTWLTGYLIDHVGYAPVFAIMGVLDLIGVAALWLMIRTPKTSPPRPLSA